MTPRKRLAQAIAGTRKDNCAELKELRDAWSASEVADAERRKKLASAVDDAACDLGCAHREESADALRGAWREFEAEDGRDYDKAQKADLKAALLALSDDEFLAIIACRCKHCGSPGEGRCYCQRDPERD